MSEPPAGSSDASALIESGAAEPNSPDTLPAHSRLRSALSAGDWEAAKLFLGTRFLIWLGAYFAFLVLVPDRNPNAVHRDDPHLIHGAGALWAVWARWDAYAFVHIAQHGYDAAWTAAFYPLYPGVLAIVGRVLGGRFVVGGVLISLAAGTAAFVLLRRLVERRTASNAVARRSLLFLALFPTSLFLSAVYSESLYLFLVVLAFYWLDDGKPWHAAAATGLAMLARPTGVAMLAALIFSVARSPRRRDWLAPLGAVAIFLVYPLLLSWQLGSPYRLVHVESAWDRVASPYGPLGGIWNALNAAWAGTLQLTVGSTTHWYWAPDNPFKVAAINLESFAYLVFFVVLATIVWKKLGGTYGIFTLVGLVQPLSIPARAYPLLSFPRFGLVLFPAFIALAMMPSAARHERKIVAVFAMLLGINIARWVLWQWVA